MCYGSKCYFEDSMGECTVIGKFDVFRNTYGYSACSIGGVITCHEDEEWQKEHKDEFKKLRKIIIGL